MTGRVSTGVGIAIAIGSFFVAPVLGEGPTDALPAIWIQNAKVTPADAHEPGYHGWPAHGGVNFGSAIAVDGGTMVAGTSFDDCSIPTWVYVFGWDEGRWKQVAKLFPSDGVFEGPDSSDCTAFGIAVAVDDEAGVIVVGNPTWWIPPRTSEETPRPMQGRIYIYERDSDGQWVETNNFTGPPRFVRPCEECPYEWGSHFGYSVDVSGARVVAGAPQYAEPPDPNGDGVGRVYVFERGDNGTWFQTSELSDDDPVPDEHFGLRVRVDRETVAVTAVEEREMTTPEQPEYGGAAFLFERAESGWEHTFEFHAPFPSLAHKVSSCLGWGLDIRGDTLVVGDSCWNEDDDASDDPGRAFILERIAGSWMHTATLAVADGMPGSDLGRSVAVNDEEDTIVVGAPHWPSYETTLGSAYVFERNADGWTQRAKLQSDETSYWDRFGWDVAISGALVLVGAPFDDNPIEVSILSIGRDAGSVYLFSPLGEALPSGVGG